MIGYTEEEDNLRTLKLVGGGLLVGALVGAAVMLFVAPQSGKKTRALVQKRSRALADHARESVEDAVEKTRDRAKDLSEQVHDRAKDLSEQVHDRADDLDKRRKAMLHEQKERVSDFVDKGKKALQRN